MSDYIPVKKLSVEDQERIYKKLMEEKPVRVKVDPREDTLEDRLRQKEAIESEYNRKSSISLTVCLVGVFVAGGFLIAPAFESLPITSYKLSFYGGGLVSGLVTMIGSGVYASIKDKKKIRDLNALGF